MKWRNATDIQYVASVEEQRRKGVDLRALADEIGASLLQRFVAL
jgi:hypothetical protein